MTATIEDLERELWLRRRERGEIKWKTRDGKEIPINEMSDSHLENAIRHVEKIQGLQELACEYEAYIESLND
jgi:hypothetical protein